MGWRGEELGGLVSLLYMSSLTRLMFAYIMMPTNDCRRINMPLHDRNNVSFRNMKWEFHLEESCLVFMHLIC